MPHCHAQVPSRLDPASPLAPPHAIGKDAISGVSLSSTGTHTAGSTSPTFFQCWELDENLRTAERIARNLRVHARHTAMPPRFEATGHEHRGDEPPADPSSILIRGHRFLRFVSRTLLGSSFVLFAAGAIIAGWSMLVGNAMLWRFAMPLVLTGESGLVLSLVTHLLAESQRDRAAGEVLVQLDRQVRRLRENATSSEPHTSVSPHLLLSDLKTQIELLSKRLRDEE